MLTKPKAQLTNGLPSLATTIKKQGEFETMKNVLILSGSPRKGGNSDLLCDEFMRGAKESGNNVTKINVASKKIAPCHACYFCGEHGGDPASVEFCHNVGLNYVSCSPYRVPIARLAAAQAAIKSGKD